MITFIYLFLSDMFAMKLQQSQFIKAHMDNSSVQESESQFSFLNPQNGSLLNLYGQPKLNDEQYSTLILYLLNYCENCQLQKQTFYIAKSYINLYLRKTEVVEESRMSLVAICCLFNAIKQFQSNQVVQVFTACTIAEILNSEYGQVEISQMENDIREISESNQVEKTPLDYANCHFICATQNEVMKEACISSLDLAITIDSFRYASSSEQFYACLWYCLQFKSSSLNGLFATISAQRLSIEKLLALKNRLKSQIHSATMEMPDNVSGISSD